MEIKTVFLYVQLTFSVWSFVRTAKFFRLPYAFCHNLILWIRNQSAYPGASTKACVIKLNSSAIYPTRRGPIGDTRLKPVVINGEPVLCGEDEFQHYNTMGMDETVNFCTKIDPLWPGFSIADRIDTKEGLELFMQTGVEVEMFFERFLYTNDEKDELNKNLIRIFSILPIFFQLKDLTLESYITTAILVVTDLFSVYLNKIWRKTLKRALIFLIRTLLMKVKDFETRIFLSDFLSSISLKFKFCDKKERNFYYVEKNEIVSLTAFSFLKDCVHSGITTERNIMGNLISSLPPNMRIENFDHCKESDIGVGIEGIIDGTIIGLEIKNGTYDFHMGLNVNGAKRRGWSGFCEPHHVPRLLLGFFMLMQYKKFPYKVSKEGNLHCLSPDKYFEDCKRQLFPLRYMIKKKMMVADYEVDNFQSETCTEMPVRKLTNLMK